jgi:uncharacterized repeat protein (TIGR01451 family)
MAGLMGGVPKADASAGYFYSAPPKVACTPVPGVTVPAGTHVADRGQILYMIQTGQIAFQFFQAGQAHPTIRFVNIYNASACHIDPVVFTQWYKVFYPEGHPLRYAGQELAHQEGPYGIPAGYGLQFAYETQQYALQIDLAIGAPNAHIAGVIENHLPLWPLPVPQCRDGQDNDGDGAADFPADFSCSSGDDNDETNPKAACQDGADNDGDGLIDFPQDPGCSSKQDNDESNPPPQTTLTVQKTGPATALPGTNVTYHVIIRNTGSAPASGVQIFDRLPRGSLTFVSATIPGCHMTQPANRPDLDAVECNPLGTIPAGGSYELDLTYRIPNATACSAVVRDDVWVAGTNATAVTAQASTTVQCPASSSSSSSAAPQCSDGLDNDGDGATDFPADFSCSGPTDNDETLPKAACQDGTDNDGDNLVDINDPGCHTDGNANNPNSYNRQDNDEFNAVSSASSSVSSTPKPACSDGVDNDNDGKIDYLDPGCYTNGTYNPNDNDETDPVQSSSSSSTPRPQCSDGMDNDNDGKIDYLDPGCYNNGVFDPNDNDESNMISSSSSSMMSSSSISSAPRPQCCDGIDNDGDGKIDQNDPGCYTNGVYNPNDNDESNPVYSSASSVSTSSSSMMSSSSSMTSSSSSEANVIICHLPPGNPANAQTITVGQSAVPAHLSHGDYLGACRSSSSMMSSSSSAAPKPQCSDGKDNDNDGKIDYMDPGCYTNGIYNPNDNDESNAASSSSSSSAHACNWCAGGNSNANIDANANTQVNNQINAGAQNNTGVWQVGGGAQNATVTPTASTEVNNQINAGSENNVALQQAGAANAAAIDANANTGVNNQINAFSQNNTGVWQIGSGTAAQNATVKPTANTQVNNQINAASQNNIWAKLFSWWK